jgi:hypothetical protein
MYCRQEFQAVWSLEAVNKGHYTVKAILSLWVATQKLIGFTRRTRHEVKRRRFVHATASIAVTSEIVALYILQHMIEVVSIRPVLSCLEVQPQ